MKYLTYNSITCASVTCVIVVDVCRFAPSWRIVHVDWGNDSLTGRNDAEEFQWILNGIKTMKAENLRVQL